MHHAMGHIISYICGNCQICVGIICLLISIGLYYLFAWIAVRYIWAAKKLQLGLLEILKDSIIAFATAMVVVWYSLNNPLIKLSQSKEIYVAASETIINQKVASFCNWLVHFEADWQSISKFYIFYLLIFVAPYFIALGLHFLIGVLPEDDDYEESKHSAFFLKTTPSWVYDLVCTAKFLLDIFVIKTPIAIGGIFCSYEIYIYCGYINPTHILHPEYLGLIPLSFFIPTIISQIIFILISHKKWMSDKENVPKIAQHRSRCPCSRNSS